MATRDESIMFWMKVVGMDAEDAHTSNSLIDCEGSAEGDRVSAIRLSLSHNIREIIIRTPIRKATTASLQLNINISSILIHFGTTCIVFAYYI